MNDNTKGRRKDFTPLNLATALIAIPLGIILAWNLESDLPLLLTAGGVILFAGG